MSNSWLIFAFCAYFLGLIGIAVVGARKIRDMSDYVLGEGGWAVSLRR